MITYPDWFRVEKETYKIISRLSSINELSFYLHSPEQFIRRLAILRVGELKLSEGMGPLAEIIENLDEDSSNRSLAAWALKSISVYGQDEILVKDRLLTRFTGQETLKDVMGHISINDPFILPDSDFNLPESSFSRMVQVSSVDTNSNFVIENPFSWRGWIISFSHAASQKVLTALKSVWSVPGKMLKQLVQLIVSTVQHAAAGLSEIQHALHKIHSRLRAKKVRYNSVPSLENKKSALHSTTDRFTTLGERLVPAAAALIRTAKNHFAIITLSAAALFMLSLNISPVNRTVEKYSGINASQVNYFLYSLSGQFLTMVSEGASDLLYGEQTNMESNTTAKPIEPGQENSKSYTVTAKNGLTLRASPSSKSPPVGSLLAYQSQVTHLDISDPNSKKGNWYKVRTPDGRAGWVYSKWLKERR